MGRRYEIVLAAFMVFVFIALLVSVHVTLEEKMPQNAAVIITLEDGLYHSIHFDFSCLANKTAKTTTFAEALATGYKPDPLCQGLGYFRGITRSLFHQILFEFGVPMDSRWDAYGNWLW